MYVSLRATCSILATLSRHIGNLLITNGTILATGKMAPPNMLTATYLAGEQVAMSTTMLAIILGQQAPKATNTTSTVAIPTAFTTRRVRPIGASTLSAMVAIPRTLDGAL